MRGKRIATDYRLNRAVHNLVHSRLRIDRANAKVWKGAVNRMGEGVLRFI